MVRIKKIFICLKLRAKLRFEGSFTVFSNFSRKMVQTWFVCHETWHTSLFGLFYCFEMVSYQKEKYLLEITW